MGFHRSRDADPRRGSRQGSGLHRQGLQERVRRTQPLGLGAAGRALAGAGRAIGGSKASLLQGAAGFVDDALVGRASPQLVGPPKPVANGVLHSSDFFPNYLPNARNENLSRTIRNILSNGGYKFQVQLSV